MTELKKEDLIFQRGESGKLIPQDVTLELLDDRPTVKIVPLTRGKIQEIYAKATSDDVNVKIQADTDVIKGGLVSPELTENEISDMKPNISTAITQAILAISLGISQEEVGKKTDEVIANQEIFLKKK